ncbi:MAG: DUF3017 domain-containing protein [Actinomycetota bacterium]|nr:DUF3017 domain-containing protein [Actinomycetota bacterium]MDQ2955968.1 DUF3017 domain-containing protein [Actinomycetota bacterium]
MVSWFHSRDLRDIPFALVLLIELVGVASVAIAPQHWLRAIGVLTAGMAVAGFFRLVLSNDQAGLLRVRRRTFDVTCYWGLGLLAMVFALTLPQR